MHPQQPQQQQQRQHRLHQHHTANRGGHSLQMARGVDTAEMVERINQAGTAEVMEEINQVEPTEQQMEDIGQEQANDWYDGIRSSSTPKSP